MANVLETLYHFHFANVLFIRSAIKLYGNILFVFVSYQYEQVHWQGYKQKIPRVLHNDWQLRSREACFGRKSMFTCNFVYEKNNLEILNTSAHSYLWSTFLPLVDTVNYNEIKCWRRRGGFRTRITIVYFGCNRKWGWKSQNGSIFGLNRVILARFMFIVLDTNIMWSSFVICRWFSPRTDCHDVTEIFLKVALSTIPQ